MHKKHHPVQCFRCKEYENYNVQKKKEFRLNFQKPSQVAGVAPSGSVIDVSSGRDKELHNFDVTILGSIMEGTAASSEKEDENKTGISPSFAKA